ncbi:DHA2 family multidrug resistance protein-like MFS transporter [Arcanobacterium wilhelmae]|uniref:DHA2 family multidrug resistance protein-like MFS transporter n=1 Tax=Arcanobacterium wilhelmae TaxID=1803177 RepID=A0ABT9NC89_9ACTO|nr:MFS transporter [Arcanobacterium wilhelmae]MDP9801335.1 DHA2 family multidrug resistance protein-like MFS transporter [Arcanobacterium wilhelmae]WFN90673.1 MFS transporter [Arcanobacterium wilhelmae]
MASKNTSQPTSGTTYQGTERLLWGIVLAVLTYWLFAGALGNLVSVVVQSIGTAHISEAIVSLAAPLAGLFSGLFIVLAGGLADRIGRVKVTLWGIAIGALGSLLVAFSAGAVAIPFMLIGRALQGISTACIMPATMALLKTYWDGAGRQRAVSMWSIGSWGGSGLSAIFGGFVSQRLDWSWIYIISAIVSVISFAMIWGTPESQADRVERKAFDGVGMGIFMVGLLGLMVALIFGAKMPGGGWASPATVALFSLAVVSTGIFVWWENKVSNPFIDFSLFENKTFTGATISNFMINATIGILNVSQLVLLGARARTLEDCASQLCRTNFVDANGDGINDQWLSTWDAGLLTLGYAIMIIGFIRVGEKLLQRYGARKPMIWGSLIVILSGLFLTPTFVGLGTYQVLAVIGYALFGLGLAFYATPSTDAALSNLPPEKAGAGSGIYKMASSLGGAIGLAISLTIFNALKGGENGVTYALTMTGVQDNTSLRFAGMVVMLVNICLTLIAIVSIVATVPKEEKSKS